MDLRRPSQTRLRSVERMRMLTKPKSATGALFVVLVIVVALVAAIAVMRGGDNALAAPAYVEPVPATGEVHEYRLVAALTPGVLTDEVETDLWTYNGTTPGPEIRISHGDTIRVILENNLPEPTSIHWHGIRVPHAMDGVPGLTQPPIAPGETFVYEFTPPDAGTYWYHSHQRGNEQLARGLYGAIVVEDPTEPEYPVDAVWLVDDWLIDESGMLDPDFDSYEDIHHSGRWGNLLTINGTPKTTLDVSPGQRIRLRIVNTANARVIKPDFDGLDPVVIAMDGLPVAEPFLVTDIDLAPGNRMDVDITIPPDAEQDFVIGDRFSSSEPVELGRISVTGASVDTPEFAPPAQEMPDWSGLIDEAPQHSITISFASEFADATSKEREAMLASEQYGEFLWTLNGRVWPDAETLTATQGELQKIRIVNESGQMHPMHLHGQFFQLISRNDEPVNETHYRDTVLMTAFQTVEIVVAPYDVGTWLLHCHIQVRAEYGMAMLYDVSPATRTS